MSQHAARSLAGYAQEQSTACTCRVRFTHSSVLWMFQPFGYCEKCCYEIRYKNTPLSPDAGYSECMLRRIAESYSSSTCHFFRNHRAVFIEAAPFSIPTGRARGFQFFHILAHTDVLLSFFVLAT